MSAFQTLLSVMNVVTKSDLYDVTSATVTSDVTTAASSGNSSLGEVWWKEKGCVVLEITEDYIPWDNPDMVVSLQTELLVDRIKSVYVLFTVGTVGVFSNIINMAVFVRQGLRDRINLCLFALAVADWIYIAQNIVLFGERLHPKFNANGARFGAVQAFMVNHNLLGLYGFVWVSQFMSAVIASERCFCVLFPLRSKTILTTPTMAVIIVVAFVVIVGGLFVVAFRFEVFCVYNAFDNSTSLIMGTSDFYMRHSESIDLLDYTVYGLILPGIFITAVVVTTIITAVKLKRVVDWRASTSSSQSSAKEVALTRMLICTSILFIVCFLPNFFFRLVCLFVKDLKTNKRYHNMYYVMLWVLDMASFVNCSLNFFVYYFVGSRFREEFWKIFAPCAGLVGKASGKGSKNAKAGAGEKKPLEDTATKMTQGSDVSFTATS